MISITDLQRINKALLESTGVDFSNYAFSSYKRRIIRFIEINKIRDLNYFVDRIITDSEFAANLIKEITVNVTEMFRDPSFWIILRDIILHKLRSKESLNIWHAACSTGEEVYSMAILLKESGMLEHTKIVATDLNRNVLRVAEKGVYQLRSMETNCKNYEQFNNKGKLSDYYSVVDNEAQFDKKLIDNVTFMCHNLGQDDSISGFDLIICRNVLIYFNFELQEKVIQTFSESMQQGSFLGIGSKESINWCKASRFFEVESYEEKIFRRIGEGEIIHNFRI
ncbi:MAG TPA: protein-glutamate O-methyltransferase CheR [Bacteroidales bacterium]|nr:protein-glutamate O-methyltransferase CheR [Bacteroidales bacterium]